jgi:hypothetical protein
MSRSLDHRAAVLLRGPAAVGKSTVKDLLLKMFGTTEAASFVNFDDGWGRTSHPIDHRYSPGPARYKDLRQKSQNLLIIEQRRLREDTKQDAFHFLLPFRSSSIRADTH